MARLQKKDKFQTYLLHFGCLVVLAVITLIYSWPLITELTTSIPGTAADHDVATFVWNHGRIYEALHSQQPLLETDTVLLPFGADLRLHTYGLLQGLAAYPFTGWLGVVGAFNLVLIISLWLNGVATYALIYDEVKQNVPALVAAVLVMFGTPVLAQFKVGRPFITALWIIALALLAFRHLLAHPRPGNVIGLGLLLLAALLSDFQILFFTTLWLGLYGLYWVYNRKQLHPPRGSEPPGGYVRLDKKRLGALLVSGSIVLIPFLLFYFPALLSSGTGDYPRPGLQGMLTYSFSIRNYFQWEIVPLAYGGYGLFVALIVSVISYRQRWVSGFWMLATGIFLLLALGPYLQPTDIPLPFAGFSLFPPLRQFRTPGRMTIPALIALGMIAGSLLAAWRPYLRKGWLIWVVAFILISGRLWFAITHDPIPLQTYPAYNFYQQLAEENGDYAILEVPFGVRSGLDKIGQGGEILQYYQHIHHKPLINGMIARLPNNVFEFYRAQPALLFLSGEPPTTTDENLRQNLTEVLNWSQACYIVVHTSMLAETAEQPILTFLDTVPIIKRHSQEADLIIYNIESCL